MQLGSLTPEHIQASSSQLFFVFGVLSVEARLTGLMSFAGPGFPAYKD